MRRFYVYLHRRPDTGAVFYVGSAGEKVYPEPCKPYKRARDANPGRRTVAWRAVVAEAGGFVLEVVSEHGSDAEARAAELAEMDRHPHGALVNQRRQIIEWNDEKRARHARSGEAHPNSGKTLSPETCRKKSEALTGERHHLKGKKLPSAWVGNLARAKMGVLNPYFGKPSPPSKAVQNTVTGAVYPSIARAAKAEGLTSAQLYQYLDGTVRNPTPLVKCDG